MANSKDRQPYLSATVLDQPFLDVCASNLENRLELTADIEVPGGMIHVSDRNKYVVDPNTGMGTFYQARTTFPTITRTLGDWLNNDVEFSSLTLEVSNVDGFLNNLLPAGANYGGFVQKNLQVSLGLAELGSSYQPIFSGRITDVAGVSRSVKSVTFSARDLFDVLNVQFPPAVFQLSEYPFIDQSLVNTVLPVIYGDWTIYTEPSPACIPALVTNSADMRANTSRTQIINISIGTAAVFSSPVPIQVAENTPVQFMTTGTLPSPIGSGTLYYAVNVTTFSFNLAYTPSGPAIDTSGTQSGTQSFKAATYPGGYANIKCTTSYNALKYFAADQVYLKRGELYFAVPARYITNVSGDNRTFEVIQDPNDQWLVPDSARPSDTTVYLYDSSDSFFVRCKGKDLGIYSDNVVWQARDILLNFTSLTTAQIDANWATLRDKASPSQSAIANIKSRVWVQDQTPALTYAKSMLEQVRLELFISADQTIKINSLHFEDWVALPSYTFKQWDIEKDTLLPTLDIRNNFNRAQASFNFQPDSGNEVRTTPFYRNQPSIDQSGTKPIGKILIYPNLYIEQDVTSQLTETLKLASSTFEVVNLSSTWRAILLDIGEFVNLSIAVGGIVYDNVPCMIRSIGYDPTGLRLPMTLWSFQLVPFPGYTPGYGGIVGGYNATITQE